MPSETMPLQSAKAALRRDIQTSLKALSAAEVSCQSSEIHERLFALPEYLKARNISVYLSMPSGEVSTIPIVKHAIQQGKRVFVPYLYKNESTKPRSLMDMVALQSEDDLSSMTRDRWGIPTPDKDSVETRARCLCLQFGDQDKDHWATDDLEDLDLIVMPGVAFDRNRQRLGHGKGFYDIFLTQYRERHGSNNEQVRMPYLVGLALHQQLLPSHQTVPTDASDWPLDSLLMADEALPQHS